MINIQDIINGYSQHKDLEAFSFSLREFVSRKMSNNLWGNGFQFFSENEEIEKAFNKINKNNKLTMLFQLLERQLSLWGRGIITINKTKTGDLFLNVPDIFFVGAVGKTFVEAQSAVIYQRITRDDRQYIIRSTYDIEKCTNTVFGWDNQKISVFGHQSDIYKALQIEEVWYHNLGFIPVVEFTNIAKPFLYYMSSFWQTLTDWYPAQAYEKLAYTTLVNLEKELKYCHSRIVLSNAPQELINQINEDFLLAGEPQNVDPLGDFIIESGMGGTATAISGVGDFNKYTNALNSILDTYFKMCGTERFSEGGGAQKTQAETSGTRNSLTEFLNCKKSLREIQIKELLNKCLAILGLTDYWDNEFNFSFVIDLNINGSELEKMDVNQKLLEMNVITPIDIIREHYKCSYSKAKEIYEKNSEFNISEQSKFMSMLEPTGNEISKEPHTKTMDSQGNHIKAGVMKND